MARCASPQSSRCCTPILRLPDSIAHTRTHMKQTAPLLLLLAFTACTSASRVGSPGTAAVDAERIASDVRTLAGDAFLGRGPATPAEDLTVNYIRDRLQAAGVEPGGPNGSWFQEVPLLQSNIVGAPTLSVNVGGQVLPLTQGNEIAVRSSMQSVDRVNIQNAEFVFLGYGIRAPERNWDDYKGQDVRGRIGIVLINDPDFESGQGDFGGKAMTYYGRWTYKYEEAARQGLAGLLIVHETAPASYGWATVKNSNTNTMFDVVRDQPSSVHPKMEGWIQRDFAVELFKNAGLDFDALKKQAATREFKPVELKGATLSAKYDVDRQIITSHNIVGRLDGSKR